MKSIRHTCACIFRLIYSHCFMKYTQQSHQKSPSTGAYYRPTNVPHIHQVMLYTLLHIPSYTEIRKMFIVLYDFSFLHQPVYRFIQSSGVYERAPVLTGNVIWKKLVATSPFPIQDLFPIRNPDDLVSMDFTCKSVRLVLCYKYYGLYEAGRWPRLHGRLVVRKVAVYTMPQWWRQRLLDAVLPVDGLGIHIAPDIIYLWWLCVRYILCI